MNVFGHMSLNWVDKNMNEESNAKAKKFFDLLETLKKPLYEGFELSLLSMVSWLINIKCEFNISNRAIDNTH